MATQVKKEPTVQEEIDLLQDRVAVIWRQLDEMMSYLAEHDDEYSPAGKEKNLLTAAQVSCDQFESDVNTLWLYYVEED